MDDKHENGFAEDGRHSMSNFSYARKMFPEIKKIWEGVVFDDVCLDYFFSPQGFKLIYNIDNKT